MDAFTRTRLIIGNDGLEILKKSNVAVFGIGGVGSFAVEALARSGVGSITMIDYDRVCITNINRQIHATMSTVGRFKTEVMRERVLSINPNAHVIIHNAFYNTENAESLVKPEYDYVIDAVDNLPAKIDLAVRCKRSGIPIISSMGAGNKMDPTGFKVADLFETSVDPIAKIMRYELKKLGIKDLKVVFSQEKPVPRGHCTGNEKKKASIGSIAFVPSVAGLILAGEVIKDLIHWNKE